MRLPSITMTTDEIHARASEILADVRNEMADDDGQDEHRFERLLGEHLQAFTTNQAETIERVISVRLARAGGAI